MNSVQFCWVWFWCKVRAHNFIINHCFLKELSNLGQILKRCRNFPSARSSMVCIINNSLPGIAIHEEWKPDILWLSHSPYSSYNQTVFVARVRLQQVEWFQYQVSQKKFILFNRLPNKKCETFSGNFHMDGWRSQLSYDTQKKIWK